MIGCTVCYQSRDDLLEASVAYGVCEHCDQPICTECLQGWAVQQIEARHFKNIDSVRVKCHQEKCLFEYTVPDLQRVLKGNPEVFEAIDRSLTMKIIRANDQYVACVNQKCKSVYYSENLEDVKACTDDLECIDCGAKWRLCGQRSKTGVLSYLAQKLMEKIYNNNTYSDLYKVLFAQQCPSCHVMIVRSEGCKFMECGKCKFQFCWLCLSEFYTEYHYYYSSCPMRIVPIYGVVIFCMMFLLLKICFAFPTLGYYAGSFSKLAIV